MAGRGIFAFESYSAKLSPGQPFQELGCLSFANRYLLAEGYGKVEGKLPGEKTGYINYGFTANQELPVRSEEITSCQPFQLIQVFIGVVRLA
jgi:hypothetical protein